jgi:molecular chaperone HtpG
LSEITQTALYAYLEKRDSMLFGKAQELREAVQGWLEYIPQTFPHYTRHTVHHSDEIVAQLSRLLFIDADVNKPTIELSATEAYILIASAYLHDAGMVTPDDEKLQIIGSDEWREWLSEPRQAERWEQVETTRLKDTGDGRAHLMADVLMHCPLKS